jgi:tRNA-splicing endonuclease subunit Sen54
MMDRLTAVDVFNDMMLIPFHDPLDLPSTMNSMTQEMMGPYNITYHVWKPNCEFKKANPRPPDFKICVVNARDFKMPTLEQTDALLSHGDIDESVLRKASLQRLKYGWRSVIIALVDSGIISFQRLSDAAFGKEFMYSPPASSKKKTHGRNMNNNCSSNRNI